MTDENGNPVIENAEEILDEAERVSDWLEELADKVEGQERVLQADVKSVVASGDEPHQLEVILEGSETPSAMMEWARDEGLRIHHVNYFEHDGDRLAVTFVPSAPDSFKRICELMREGLTPMQAVVFHAKHDRFLKLYRLSSDSNSEFSTGRAQSNLRNAARAAEDKLQEDD